MTRGDSSLVPSPVCHKSSFIYNTDFDINQVTIYAYTHTRIQNTHTLVLCAYTNALRGNRVLTRCHHHSLEEAIMDRTLIYHTDIPASFSPRATYPLWVIGKIV